MHFPKLPDKLFKVILVIMLLTGCAAPKVTPTFLPTYPPTATSTLVVAPAKTTEPASTQTSLPGALPAEFVWKIVGNPNPFSRPIVEAVVGLVPLVAGLFDFCVFAPLFGAPMSGPKIRVGK
jgi:hypothetical protein